MFMKLFGSLSFLFWGGGWGKVNLIMLKLISCRLSVHFVSLQVGDTEAAAKA